MEKRVRQLQLLCLCGLGREISGAQNLQINLDGFIYINNLKLYLMSFNEQSSEKVRRASVEQELPTNYFHLIQRVGDSGKYQMFMAFIFLICWFVTGMILLSTAFLFRNRSFDCKAYGLLLSDSDCSDYVCQLPENKWADFVNPNDKDFTSLATQDNYLCSKSAVIDLVSSSTYFGAFIGYIVISFFSDNFGRKSSMVVSWGICTMGTIILACSVNIYMVAMGLFFSGCGCDASINICFFFFGEVVGDAKRQKYSVFVQIFFTIGAMTVTLFFSLIDSWRINWIVLVVCPAILQLVLLIIYIEQTPQFLVKKGVEATRKALNRIGRINTGRKSILDEEDIQNVMDNQIAQDFNDKYITPIDLCRFPSLRLITITCSTISFMTYAMYYGPALIIDDIGFDIFVSSYLVNLSELLTFVPSFFLIQKIPRRVTGIIMFLGAGTCALLLTFIEKPEQCDLCIQSILEIIIIFIFRGCVSFFFCFFQVYFCELYPARARGMGAGIVSAVGTLAATSSPIYLGYLRRNGINVMGFFVLFAIIAIGNLFLLYQTKGAKLKEEIEEIELQKEKRRSHISFKSSKIKPKSQLSDDPTNKSQRSHKEK